MMKRMFIYFVAVACLAMFWGYAVAGDFIKNGDGTITDISTGLMWQKNDDVDGMNWDSAVTHCKNLKLAGNTDWRLPKEDELLTLIEKDNQSPMINKKYFATNGVMYWTGTSSSVGIATPEGITSFSTAVNFKTGDVKANRECQVFGKLKMSVNWHNLIKR